MSIIKYIFEYGNIIEGAVNLFEVIQGDDFARNPRKYWKFNLWYQAVSYHPQVLIDVNEYQPPTATTIQYPKSVVLQKI